MWYRYLNQVMTWCFQTIGLYLFYQYFLNYWNDWCIIASSVSLMITNYCMIISLVFKKESPHTWQWLSSLKKLSEALDRRDCVIGVFLDFSNAFDTVDHKIILQKLEIYGIKNISLKWFESYLTERTQYVTYNSIKSSRERVNCGVPQGSILDPLLFLLYI